MKKSLMRMTTQVLPYVHSAFQTLLIVYLVLLLVNQFKVLFYPAYLNILLGVVLVLGVITVLTKTETLHAQEKRSVKDTLFIWGLGIIGVVLLFLKTGSLGWLQYVISLLGGALIVVLGYLVYEPETEEKPTYLAVSFRGVGVALLALFVLSAVVSVWLGWSAFRIVFGAVVVLFVPGFSLSYSFFGVTEIDALERIALSFALSIAVVPLLVFYLNLAGLKISAWSVLAVVTFVTAAGYIVYWYKPALVKRFHARRH